MKKIKFSIIVPVYNTEKYLDKCLTSIVNQNYKNMEVIVVNDGSTDDSLSIIKKYEDKYSFIKCYTKKNGGLSDARNYGIKKASGDYLLFVDSDDYMEENLLKYLANNIKDEDIVRFNFKLDKDDTYQEHVIKPFTNLSGKEAFNELIKSNYFVVVWTYAVKKSYFDKFGYSFTKGIYHEDFALTPIMVRNASSVSSLDCFGYYYVVRENSIMTNTSSEKLRKKAWDTLKIYDDLINYFKDDKIYQSYIANSVIYKAITLSGDMLKEYISELKKRNVCEYVLDDTLKRKIKKLVLRLSLPIYIKYFI